ncbi:MAG TPA: DUF2142 domain-containing protein, partial [Cellulomonadaceae bacterium]|nr:DUF2142 domain-containing protein [Cellulomonadaceae bacterium]
MTESPVGRPRAPRGRRRDLRVFWVAWAVLMLLTSAWSLANPLMASPDEPAHTVKAAAVVRGELLGPDVQGGTQVRVPYFYNRVTAYPVCYMFRPDVTGVCDPAVTQPLDETVLAITPAGRYNPLYYAIVGLPTLLPPGDGVLYAMRLLSAALCTFFLALGMRAIAQTPRPAWAVLGAASAVTPMVVFLSSTVNPAALEIATAFALWAQLSTLLRHPDPGRIVSRMAWIAVTTTFLVNSRGLSLLYCAIIVTVVLLLSPWRSFLDVVRTRGTWPSFGVIVAACAAAALWVFGTNSLGSGGALAFPGLTFLGAAKTTIFDSEAYLTNMVGQFGWMDTNLSPVALMAFAMGAGVVVLLAVAVGTWRDRIVLAVVAGLTFGLPVIIQASQARYLGIIWQGRYILPIAIGLPLLAGYVLVRRLGSIPHAGAVALTTVVAGVVALVQVAAFAENLHRYVNGRAGGWLSLSPHAWLPPLPLVVVVGLGAVGAGAYAWMLVWVARADPEVTTGAALSPAAGP